MDREFKFGDGKISGLLAIVMASMALGAVICFHFPSLLTTPQLREIYPVDFIRGLVMAFIIISAALAILSTLLAPKKYYGFIGMTLAMIAALAGGGHVEVQTPVQPSNFLGFDWFILDLLILSIAFVPLERIFALRHTQRIFRQDWHIDLIYFCVNHVLLQVIMIFTMMPAQWLQSKFNNQLFFDKVARLNPFLQFVLILLFVDFFQYWIHRAFHQIRFLWKFHAIHHSAEQMDWLAGSRLHFFDIIFTRALIFLPLSFIGFDTHVLQNYLVFAAFQTVFIHANVRWDLQVFRFILVTPAYHHWHHGSERAAIDKNFCVHVPLYDLLFGTFHAPINRWPEQYGLDREKIPVGFWRQFIYPFKKQR